MSPVRSLLLACLVGLAAGKKNEDPRDCEVCRAVISQIDELVTPAERKTVEGIEAVMQKYCDSAKGKEKTMCYYMGIGDKELGTAGGVKREVSGSLSRGINAKRLCTRMKKQDAQMCELRYEKKVDVKNTDLSKLRVKELRKICDDEGIPTKGFNEKGEFIKAIKDKFGIKDEM
ncbi:hypothetical protein EMIHUDRAFT_433800 [Emiliania huxleyi CCMP1516]|uniref:Mesencephalic astrocyte-derived neurotrophic factor homolog n=2 Tax=Emiliania huxleyi TaxID=2903 RepID=A0A0D3KI08_EMIH1|nr:hypothetical protein EMIHUDRAFT_433800 [Emiliania huxleyi CCMP1516]EOD35393.1 hypothetical protein EMIHUDRAFT_433800 [Emiliania huxleyi CCMP1516]|eukprot:XP_005787822.1 hypothetical protein EMIHUDRAFT_433800 [Emiliania huxleyi CCMP1516]